MQLKTHFVAANEVWDPGLRIEGELLFLGPIERKG
jgi:hypothetical protein